MKQRIQRTLLSCLLLVCLLIAGLPAIPAEAAAKTTIKNVSADYAIQAKVKLNGSGTGYHAKLVICTATAATSFGIQFDNYAAAPYTGKAGFLIENVRNNNAGGQDYIHTGECQRKKNYTLLMAYKSNGDITVYVNGKKQTTVNNPSLANQQVYLRVEGSGRLNGDRVKAVFSDIKLMSGSYDKNKRWGTYKFDTNPNVRSNTKKFAKKRKVTISGAVTGLAAGQDWDSAYESVSGITQFIE